jgi:hypothetical protein
MIDKAAGVKENPASAGLFLGPSACRLSSDDGRRAPILAAA